jgi:O-antigen ligase
MKEILTPIEKQSNQKKILSILFFGAGIIWILADRFFDIFSMIIICEVNFFLLITRGKIALKGINFIALNIILILILNFLINALFELISFSYIPFHSIYSLSETVTSLCRYIIIPLTLLFFLNCFESDQGIYLQQMFTYGAMLSLSIVVIGVLGGFIVYSPLRFSIFGMHSSIFARNLVGYIYCFLIACRYMRRLLMKIICALCILLAFCFIILALARSALFSLLMGIFFASIFIFDRKKVLFCAIICISLFFILGLEKKYSSISSFMPTRFTIERMSKDKGSGRLDLWKDYFQYATLRDYLIGRGYNRSLVTSILYQKPLRAYQVIPGVNAEFFGQEFALQKTFGIAMPHNTYIMVLLGLGIIIFILYLLFLFSILIRIFLSVKKGTTHWFSLAIIITFIVRGVADVELSSKSSFLLSLALSQIINQKLNYKCLHALIFQTDEGRKN